MVIDDVIETPFGLAGRVTEAAKEGGFLGIGGTRVDEQEKTALSDIGKALGVSV